MPVLRVLGFVIGGVGLLLATFPDVFGGSVPEDGFKAIERRIPWGALLGAGLALTSRESLRPWLVTIPTVLFCLTFGLLVSRVLGLLLDGPHPRQWMWVAVEAVIAAVFAGWIWYTKDGS